MNEEELYKKAIKHWGEELQVGMLMEEVSEMLIAVNKLRRNKCLGTIADLEDEIADVRIMIDQIIVLFNLNEMTIKVQKGNKLIKLKNMIDGGK